MRASRSTTNQPNIQRTEPAQDGERARVIERRVTQLPAFTPHPTGIVYGGGSNDGVFANLSAKPERGEKVEEHPPVSQEPFYMEKSFFLIHHSHTNKLLRMRRLPTGKRPFLLPGLVLTKFTLTALP
jgi:hypothetical protein